jgi:3-hydroxymyristoyl/3-hydroxydecanoyl-(acyl carrier protein) dehydratase
MFQGHFPGDAIAPGYCLLELISEVLTASAHKPTIKTIQQAKFHHPLRPGDCLDIDICLEPATPTGLPCEAMLRCGDQLILEFSGTFAESQYG